MSRLTECFSMYSLMSMRTIARSSSKRKSASDRASSVLPTPVGPRKRNEPIGRLGSERPARLRRMALATATTASSWPMTRSCSTSSRRTSLAISPSMSRLTGTPVHLLTTSAMSSSSTSSFSIFWAAWSSSRRLGGLGDLALELGQLAVADLGGLLEVGLALELGALVLELLLERPDAVDGVLLGLPVRLHAGDLLAQVGELLVERGEALLGGGVGLLGQRHPLDLELADAALDDVDLGGHRVDLDAQLGGGLVDEVDGLVGQEPAGEVAVGEHGGGDERGVLDADAVVHLVALLEAAEDGDGVLDRRLVDEDLLEAALEGGVLLDVLAVLVERGGADHAQLAAGEQRLEHVAGVHRALGRAGADDGVHLVDEGDDLALGVGDLLEDGLEPLLELAAVLGAGDHRAEVERDEPLVLQALGHVALDDAAGEALDDGGLADAGLADEHRVVLGAARQHLDDAADLLVAADDRVDLARRGRPR